MICDWFQWGWNKQKSFAFGKKLLDLTFVLVVSEASYEASFESFVSNSDYEASYEAPLTRKIRL